MICSCDLMNLGFICLLDMCLCLNLFVVSRFYYDYSGLNYISVMKTFVLKGIMTLGLYVYDIW